LKVSHIETPQGKYKISAYLDSSPEDVRVPYRVKVHCHAPETRMTGNRVLESAKSSDAALDLCVSLERKIIEGSLW
jgi:hypothetical protein